MEDNAGRLEPCFAGRTGKFRPEKYRTKIKRRTCGRYG